MNAFQIGSERGDRNHAATIGAHMVALNIRVPRAVRRQLKVHAAANGMTMCELLLTTFRRAGILRGSLGESNVTTLNGTMSEAGAQRPTIQDTWRP